MGGSPTKASTEPSKNDAPTYELIGWVPTANGRLSFRHVGDVSTPNICKYANLLGSGGERLILGFQKRNLSDLLFSSITEVLTGRDGCFYFLFQCTSSGASAHETNFLSGDVHIFTKARWRGGFRETINSCVDRLNALRLVHNNLEPVRACFAEAKSAVIGKSEASVRFKLNRDGTFLVSLPVFSDRSLFEASDKYASEIGLSFGDWVANQAYFFIRDVCHVHQHHSPSVDTILILQKNDGKRESWPNSILYSLHHYVIKTRRSASSENLYRALGVLAYAQSFAGNFSVRGECNLPAFNYEAIAASIQARIGEHEAAIAHSSRKDSRWQGARSQYLAVIALIVALIAIVFNPGIRTGNERIKIMDELIEKNLIGILYGILFAIALGLVFFRGWHPQIRFLRDLSALGIARRPLIGIVSILISICVFFLAGYLAFLSR